VERVDAAEERAWELRPPRAKNQAVMMSEDAKFALGY
jgi:hypothetical protein